MIFHPTTIAGALLIEPEPREDARGGFTRIHCKRELAAQGVTFEVAQTNLAYTYQAGVVRGLHYLDEPHREQKLTRCITGAVFLALVDMRPTSTTYRAVYHARLDAAERLALFVPSGIAHGYQTLVDNAEIIYMSDHFYTPGIENGVRYNDPAVAIPWPLAPKDVSERDAQWPLIEGR